MGYWMVANSPKIDQCELLMALGAGGVIIEGMRYIDTGAAFSYVHNISKDFPSGGTADECAFDGRPWTAPMRRVPCEFAGHPFEILCGDAQDNPAYVPPEGVIGYDFFANFILVVDRVGGEGDNHQELKG